MLLPHVMTFAFVCLLLRATGKEQKNEMSWDRSEEEEKEEEGTRETNRKVKNNLTEIEI